MNRSTPPRRTISFDPVVNASSSPKSVMATYDSKVVWGDEPHDDDPFDTEHSRPPFELPSLKDINDELQRLVKQSACSKASYRAKLGKMTNELHEANRVVQSLEQQLSAARQKQSIAQRAMEDAKQKREDENERFLVRKLHLHILRRCMADRDLLPEIQGLRESERSTAEKYEEHSSLELAVIRRRLEGIRALLDKAEKAGASKSFETKAQAETMKKEALSTYVLFHKFSQI